jgi:hypothetical protein
VIISFSRNGSQVLFLTARRHSAPANKTIKHKTNQAEISAENRTKTRNESKERDMRVAISARIPTKDKGLDRENQLQHLLEFTKEQGWTVIHEYVDHFNR